MIEPLDEIPLWNKRHSRSFVNAALELSSHHEKGKGKRQDVINRQILQRLTENVGERNLDEVEDNILVEKRSIVDYMEHYFKRATEANSKFVYVYNYEHPPQGVTSCLSGISGHLDPANNSRVGKMPGINTSMFYVGNAGSFTELHVEDSIADSANIIHAGKVKTWMIVAREDYFRLNCIIAQIMKKLQPDSKGKCEENREICELPLHHKNLVLTPRFLDEHEIRYEFIVHNAGDLVYV